MRISNFNSRPPPANVQSASIGSPGNIPKKDAAVEPKFTDLDFLFLTDNQKSNAFKTRGTSFDEAGKETKKLNIPEIRSNSTEEISPETKELEAPKVVSLTTEELRLDQKEVESSQVRDDLYDEEKQDGNKQHQREEETEVTEGDNDFQSVWLSSKPTDAIQNRKETVQANTENAKEPKKKLKSSIKKLKVILGLMIFLSLAVISISYLLENIEILLLRLETGIDETLFMLFGI